MSTTGQLFQRERTRVGKVPISTKVFQAIGALPEALKNWAFSAFLLFFYNEILGVNALKASVAIAMALIIDAACDPLIGSFSDSLKTKLGRRHPLMYLSAIPIGIGLFLVFSPPHGLGETALLGWLFVTVVITHVSMSLFVVPWTALYAEFSDDYAERTVIVTWRYAIGLLGSLTFIFCTYQFIFASTPQYKLGQLNPHAYPAFAPVAALSVMAAILLTTELTRREVPYLMQPVYATPRLSLTRVWRDVSSTFNNRDFLMLFFGALTTAAVTGTTDTLGTYVQTFFWGLGPDQLKLFSISTIGALFAFIALGAFGRLFDKKLVLLSTFIVLILDGMGVIGLRLLHVLPPNGSNLLLVILIANETFRSFLGVLLGIMFVSMLADTIDVQELNTGRRQEGIFSAALSFSGKATAGVGTIVGGFLLQEVVHWPAHADPRTLDPHTVITLGLVVGVLVPLLLVVPTWFGMQYRITREQYAKIQEELTARRAAAHMPPPENPPLDLEMAVVPPGAQGIP